MNVAAPLNVELENYQKEVYGSGYVIKKCGPHELDLTDLGKKKKSAWWNA